MPEINQRQRQRQRQDQYQTSLTTIAAREETDQNILFGKYELGKLLGSGGFAKVYHARDLRSGENVAVKSVSKRKIEKLNLMAHVKREVAIMRKLRHPHIIHLIEVLATRSKIYFIMEFAKGGELFSKLTKGRFSEDLSRRYFRQLISAVRHCHSHGVFHRDLKPENLLLDENWSLKVSDFGLSAINDPTRPDLNSVLHTLCGTPAYVAPEILAKKGYNGAKVDIWSCGIILFVLTAGYLPFNDANLMNLYRKIYRGEFRCPKWFSPELRVLLGRILDTNPDTRITIDEIVEDAWFKKGCVYNEVKLKWKWEDECVNNNSSNDNDDDKRRFLNAFDLISFSPGFSLSGLFGEGENCRETVLVAAKEVEMVVARIEEAARGIHAPKVEVERVKGGMGVKVEGQNGNFALVVEVHRLTEELTVVEVWKREKDVGPSHEFWREKLKPRIQNLFVQSGRSELISNSRLN